MRLIPTLLFAALVACHETQPVPSVSLDTTGKTTTDTTTGVTTDTNPDDTTDPTPQTPGQVTFRLRFVSDQAGEKIYLQTGTAEGPQEWVSIQDAQGNRLRMHASCALCDCSECDRCAVCGAAFPRVDALESGQHRDESYTGALYPYSTCDSGHSCRLRTVLPDGAYVARFCWSLTTEDMEMGSSIGTPVCAEVPFTAPLTGQVVEHLVDHGG